MSKKNEILSRWSSKPYNDISSYTLGHQTELLQHVMRDAFRRVMIKRLRRVMGEQRLARVVDLACGAGEWTVDYLELAEQVVGVDINPQFLDHAARRARASTNAERLELRRMNIAEFDDYADADLVCFGACLQLVDDEALQDVIARAAAGLSSAGHIYIRTTIRCPRQQPGYSEIGYYRSRQEYEDLFRRNGLVVADAGYTFSLTVQGVLAEALELRADDASSRVLERALHVLLCAWHWCSGKSNYINWILRPMSACGAASAA